MLNRRRFLVAGGAAALLGQGRARAVGGDDATLRTTLDGLGRADPQVKLERLGTFSPARLSPPAALDLLSVRSGLRVDAELIRCFPFSRPGKGPYAVSVVGGAWRDAVPDVARIDADTAAILNDAGAGVVLPRALLDRTVRAVRGAAAGASGAVRVALDRQATVLDGLRGQSGILPGVGRLSDGGAYFALLVDRQTGLRCDPATLHAQFVEQWHRIRSRADVVLSRIGLRHGAVGDRIMAAFREARWQYSDDDAGRDRAVAEMNRWLDRARRRIPVLFGEVPPWCLDVSARRMSAPDEAARRPGYRVVAGPGRSGVYYVDLADIRRRPCWTLPGVVHHELLPGHMIQLPMEDLANPHPLRIEYAPGFAEGWAIYAEQLAVADGAMAGDERALLGHLHWLLFRIGRGIVDTGIHVRGWSVETALAMLHEVQGEPAYFAAIAADVDRICLEPGMRAAEALNWLTLADRSARARDRIAFHRALLDHGRRRLDQLPMEGGRP